MQGKGAVRLEYFLFLGPVRGLQKIIFCGPCVGSFGVMVVWRDGAGPGQGRGVQGKGAVRLECFLFLGPVRGLQQIIFWGPLRGLFWGRSSPLHL